MRLAVKFWGDASVKPLGMPDSWPMLCVQIEDNGAVPDGFIAMTLDQYRDYRALHQSEYDAWSSGV